MTLLLSTWYSFWWSLYHGVEIKRIQVHEIPKVVDDDGWLFKVYIAGSMDGYGAFFGRVDGSVQRILA